MPIYRSASGSSAEDLLIRLFSDTFDTEKACYHYSQNSFSDIYQNSRFADFLNENTGGSATSWVQRHQRQKKPSCWSATPQRMKVKSANSLLMHSLYAVTDTGKRAYKLLNLERQQPGAKGSGRSPSLVTQTADVGSVSELFEAVKIEDKSLRPKESSEVADREGHSIQKGAPQKLENIDIRWITVDEIDQYEFCPADEDILAKLRVMGSK